jgi:hypothetical protein
MQITKCWHRCGAALGLAVMLLAGISGCGKLATGANAVPNVRYRADVAAVESGGGAETPAEVATTNAGGFGNLKGRVVFEGSFSPPPPLFAKGAATKDPTVCGAEAIPDERIIVNGDGLANVFVYLEKTPKGVKPSPVTDKIDFDQKTCIFLPHAMVVRTKQVVNVLNDDAAAHNTHTFPTKGSSFNSVVQPSDRVGVPLKYDQAEKQPVSVRCDIHAWMQAYHLPLDHPFAAVSKADGSFEIKDLPAGTHDFRVWHEVGEMVEKSLVVTIKPGDNEITIKVPASKLVK